MSVPAPVYKVEIWSGSTKRFSFGYGAANNISDLRVKPGLTNAIGSFEVNVPDSENVGTGGKYKTVLPYEDVKIWLGYGSELEYGIPFFKGKIDTIRSKLSTQEGWTRSFIGRDYGEALFRILKRRAYTGSAYDAVQNLRDNASLNATVTYIASSANVYPMVLENDDCFKGLKDISDFDNKDFYVDTEKDLHWFERQSITGNQSFVIGTNILDCAVDRDITSIFNDIYVFGMRDPSNISGSDIPTNHDDWTESTASGWNGWVKSGSGESTNVTISVVNTYVASGSKSLELSFGINGTETNAEFWVSRPITGSDLRAKMLNGGDTFHLYNRIRYLLQGCVPYIRLETDNSNYFECKLEREWNKGTSNSYFPEKTIDVGPSYEGVSSTGSEDTWTGSYQWTRVGSPDWYNLNSIKFYAKNVGWTQVSPGTFYYYIDGLYFGTRFQARTTDLASSGSYGYRPHVEISEKFNSNQYCLSEATTLLAKLKDPIVQIQLTTTGSVNLQVGTRYLVTIPAESINTYYELIDLEHLFRYPGGFVSTCTFTNNKEIRTPIPLINYPVAKAIETKTLWEIILDMFKAKPAKRLVWVP